MYEFYAQIQKVSDMDATYVEVPIDIKAVFGKGRLKVAVWFDNVFYEGCIVRMGTPCYILGVNKNIRNQLNKQAGDTVKVRFEEKNN